jgi:hypothetical protein
VKQNIDKLISLWKQGNEKRNSAVFGDLVKNDGTIVTTRDQLLVICDVFFEMDPFMSNRRVVAPRSGLLEDGVSGGYRGSAARILIFEESTLELAASY